MIPTMSAAVKLASIEAALRAGRTVYLQTSARTVKIALKHWLQWEAAGRPLLKVVGTSLYLASGKRYVCADYCAITIQ